MQENSPLSPQFLAYAFDLIDDWCNHNAPNGVTSDEIINRHTNRAFEYFVAKYGLPKTANEARFMFEWASVVDTTMAMLYQDYQSRLNNLPE